MMRKILSLLIFALAFVSARSQSTGIEIEVAQVHYGVVGSTDLTGYVTYHVYATFTNEDDFLSAVYGFWEGDDALEGNDMVIDAPCGCFNHPQGGAVASQVNGALCMVPGFEDLCWDTFWTIGMLNTLDPGDCSIATTVPPPPIVDPCAQPIDDGAVFTTYNNVNGYAGEDLRVLIAQVTTCGDISVDVSIQTFVDDCQSCEDQADYEVVIEQQPCIANPLDATVTVTDPLLCFGELATVELGGGGNGTVDMDLWASDTDGNPIGTDPIISQSGDFVFDELPEGNYFIAMIDSVGCIDTTEVFGFTEPTELIATNTLTANNLCFGEDIAEICTDVVGGIEPYEIAINDCAGGVSLINNNECLSDLACTNGCGDYTVIVTDDNGCEVEETIVIDCPTEIVIDATTNPIQCAFQCDGSVTGTISGGTGLLNVTVDPPINGFPIDQASPISLEMLELCEGDYTLTVTDENGCEAVEIFSFTEPEPITVTYTTENASCFGFCDGSIQFEASGGTPSYTHTVTDLDGNEQDANALCAGEFIAITTDQNQCPIIDTLTIEEPTEITFNIASTDISCFGADDGEICFEDTQGGVGTFEFQITAPANEATPFQPDSCFTGLSAGSYSLTVIDETLCTAVITGVVIDEPGELVINLNPTDISCFGLTDGMIEVTSEGGTGAITIVDPVTETVPFTITDLAAGNYPVTIEDETGCQASSSADINEPTEVFIDITGTTEIGCGGDCDGTVQFETGGGTGDLTVLFNNEDLDPNALCAGEYMALSCDLNGCCDSSMFEIVQPDPIEILTDITPVTCTGMNDGALNVFPIGGTGPLTWEATDAEGEEIDLNNLFEGEYFITAMDSTGCSTDTTVVMFAAIQTDMEITIFTSPVTCWDASDGTATAAVTGGNPPIVYQWTDPLSQTTATAVGLSEDVYSVTITDAIGCTLSEFAEVEPTIGCFFIATALTPNGDGFNDEWIVGGLEYYPQAIVQVFNRWGQLLFESKGYSTRWDGTWNGNLLPVADYYYVITYDENENPITGTVTIKY